MSLDHHCSITGKSPKARDNVKVDAPINRGEVSPDE